MASIDDYLMLQYLMMFAVSIIFTMMATDKDAFLSILISSASWLITAILSFIYAPTVVGSVVGWSFGLLCGLLFGVFMLEFIQRMSERRLRRFEVVGIL